MAVLLENVTNCLWLAFSALRHDQTGHVHKTKLKVLTANIGTLFDLYGIERGIEHYRSTSTLNFDQYKFYLQREVFVGLPDKLVQTELRLYETKIAEICWTVCKKLFYNKQLTGKQKYVFSEHSAFQLFRIFCVLGELVPDKDKDTYQVLLHASEATHVAHTLATSLGHHQWDDEDFGQLCQSIGSFRFVPFLATLETRCLIGKVRDSSAAITEAVKDLYQTFVEDVIKKGFLSKRGFIFHTMKEYWFVLRPSELVYYKSRAEKDRCGIIILEASSRIEPKSDYKFVIHTSERNHDLGASDNMSLLQWLSALQIAVEHSDCAQSYQRLQASKRRIQRLGRMQEILKAKAQLQAERNARQIAEGHAKELEELVREESKKLNELEMIKDKLEKLLVEETQAKRDEEIVRALQARVLAEEWEKREELERLQVEMNVLLKEEREKRLEYEELQMEKEKQLDEAQLKLAQLETERKLLDDQLKDALEKIKVSENSKELLETRLLKIAPGLRETGDKLRRAHSFMPSTKERPIILDVKSHTLRKMHKC